MNVIQWYPGHMTKARRNIEKDIRLCDLVIELRDARIPYSTENPDIRKLSSGKKRLILLNKADLADPEETRKWISFFQKEDCIALALDSRNRGSLVGIQQALKLLMREKQERDAARGIIGVRAVKAMVLGIPNVGKSTLINTLTGKTTAVTGNKPGVTKGNQWINAGKELMLLDTPGVLWPRFEDRGVGYRLAAIGSINDEILDRADLSVYLLSFLLKNYRELLLTRYQISEDELTRKKESTEETIIGLDREALGTLELIAEKRNCRKKGSVPDLERASGLFIDDFRSGKIGHISLEKPYDKK